MKLDLFEFDERFPKRGNVVCFSEKGQHCGFYHIDHSGSVWTQTEIDSQAEYCCEWNELQHYGFYKYWAREKDFKLKFDIPND